MTPDALSSGSCAATASDSQLTDLGLVLCSFSLFDAWNMALVGVCGETNPHLLKGFLP